MAVPDSHIDPALRPTASISSHVEAAPITPSTAFTTTDVIAARRVANTSHADANTSNIQQRTPCRACLASATPGRGVRACCLPHSPLALPAALTDRLAGEQVCLAHVATQAGTSRHLSHTTSSAETFSICPLEDVHSLQPVH